MELPVLQILLALWHFRTSYSMKSERPFYRLTQGNACKCIWVFSLGLAVRPYISSCRWSTCSSFPRCLNSAPLTDLADSSRDEGCYGYPKTDAHSDRCPAACVVGIRVRCSGQMGHYHSRAPSNQGATHPFSVPLSSFVSVHWQQIAGHEIM